jgi:hypothetical protein
VGVRGARLHRAGADVDAARSDTARARSPAPSPGPTGRQPPPSSFELADPVDGGAGPDCLLSGDVVVGYSTIAVQELKA